MYRLNIFQILSAGTCVIGHRSHLFNKMPLFSILQIEKIPKALLL
uniref:Uncharacterized protein n=1 Tax=Anguilla anguilla TaxID=7936 RepID=A0A0E9UBD7_ANGAN